MRGETYKTYTHDLLVIGAGGAGLRAAIEAASQGASVGIVCKSLLGKAHTVMAEGGMAAALANVDGRDSWQVHFRDTMKGGKFLNNWRMVEVFAKEAPERVMELERWGAVFDRTRDGRINQRHFGGHLYPRLAHVGDRTGLELIRTLQDQVVRLRIPVYMECTIHRLLKDGDRIAGAVGYWRHSGEFVVFRAKAVVLATGGLGRIYQITSNSWECTGDGFALAAMAGADLIDMEFVQFHPTGMVWPPGVMGTLVTEGVRGEGGVLRNNKGERFMFRYIPEMYRGEFAETEEEARRWVMGDQDARRHPELLTRDVIARAIRREVLEGRGSPHGGVFLDIASQRDPDYIRRKLPSMYHQFKKLANLDITKEPMEVGPTCHYMMGGIRVDPETQATSVPGLFAAGEVAAGLHGTNRLGGNSLTDLLVFGRRAGLYATQYANGLASPPSVDETEVKEAILGMLEPFQGPGDENPFSILKDLRTTMQAKVGIVRVQRELLEALDILQLLRERTRRARAVGSREYNPGWHTALDLRLMLATAEAVATAALERKESRGGHAREDYPDSDPQWGQVNLVLRWKDGTFTVNKEPLPPMPEELKALVER